MSSGSFYLNHRTHSPTSSITNSLTTMFTSGCRAVSLFLISLLLGALIVSGIVFTSVRAQQSGSVPSNKTIEKVADAVLAPNSNNYAASIAALTVGKPTHYQSVLNAGGHGHHHHHHHDNLLEDGEKDKYSGTQTNYTASNFSKKLYSSSSSFKPSSFSLFNPFADRPSDPYFNYPAISSKCVKHVSPPTQLILILIPKPTSIVFTVPPNNTPVRLMLQPSSISPADSYSIAQLYSPYMMPISNYYTGSSSPASAATTSTSGTSSSASSTTSPYHYSAFAHHLPAASQLKPSLLSFKDRLEKWKASANQKNTTKPETEQEKLTKQLQLALMYHQLMALQQYRAMTGGMSGAGYGAGIGAGYPESLYQSYYQAQQQAAASSENPTTTSSGTSDPEPSKSNSESKPTPEELQQAIAETVAYRQQLASIYGGSGYGGSASAYGGGSPYGSASSTFGYPSSPYSAGAYSGLSGATSGGIGSLFRSPLSSSSLLGGGAGTGGRAVLGSLTGGLSSLTGLGSTGGAGSGFGLLNSLGMLFG